MNEIKIKDWDKNENKDMYIYFKGQDFRKLQSSQRVDFFKDRIVEQLLICLKKMNGTIYVNGFPVMFDTLNISDFKRFFDYRLKKEIDISLKQSWEQAKHMHIHMEVKSSGFEARLNVFNIWNRTFNKNEIIEEIA